MCYNVYTSVNVSVRLDDSLAERLRLRARAAGETLSDRLRRYADEGIRQDEHPLIAFRDGPTGRRAGVVGGPDVWEIVMWLEDLAMERMLVEKIEGLKASESDLVTVLVEESPISRPQIDAARRYYRAYPDEIDARVALHRAESTAASRF